MIGTKDEAVVKSGEEGDWEAPKLNATSTVQENRKSNLRLLYQEYATQRDLAKAIGSKPPQVSQMLRGDRGMGEITARRVERMLGLPKGWMDYPQDKTDAPIANPGIYSNVTPVSGAGRRVPVLSSNQLDDPIRAIDKGDFMEEVVASPSVSNSATEHLFMYRLECNSMAPDFGEGDGLFFDPGQPVGPGDFVLAKLDGEIMFRKYRPLDKNGDSFQLVPVNPDWPTLQGGINNGDRVIARLVAHLQLF